MHLLWLPPQGSCSGPPATSWKRASRERLWTYGDHRAASLEVCKDIHSWPWKTDLPWACYWLFYLQLFIPLYARDLFIYWRKKKKNLFTSWAHQWQVTPVPKLSIPSEACVWGRGAYQLSQKLGRRPSKLVQGLPVAPEDPQSPLNHSLPRPQRQETQQDWLCYKILKLPYLIAILKACRTRFRGGSYIWDYQSSKEAACSQQSLTRDRDH